jgi:hypothetical protein
MVINVVARPINPSPCETAFRHVSCWNWWSAASMRNWTQCFEFLGDLVMSKYLWQTSSPLLSPPDFLLWTILRKNYLRISLSPSTTINKTLARRLQHFLRACYNVYSPVCIFTVAITWVVVSLFLCTYVSHFNFCSMHERLGTMKAMLGQIS